MKTALVLSGGSIKGAFQAGAVNVTLHSGIEPSAIYGISVGSLNGGFLADRAGAAARAGRKPNWPQIGDELALFWLNKITSFGVIGKKRNSFSLLWNILWSKFNGVLDTGPLHALIKTTLNEENLRESPVVFQAGSVNLRDGSLLQSRADESYPMMRDFILASTAIPIVMPISFVKQLSLLDGGVRDVAPLSAAINDGADEIICVLCQQEQLEPVDVRYGNLMELAERLMEIVVAETVSNDIDRARQINDFCMRSGGPSSTGRPNPATDGYRIVPITVIRPAAPLEIKLTKFGPEDIRRIYELGRNAAQSALAGRGPTNQVTGPRARASSID
jgi:NTE family protein